MQMLGKTQKGCHCCPDDTKTRTRRTLKRRERQAWKKAVR